MSTATQKKNRSTPFWFGGVASAMACTLTHPLDLLKVRLQTLDSTPSTTTGSSASSTINPSLRSLFWNIIRSEGPTALFTGLSAALLRQLSYSTARFGLYDEIKRRWVGSSGSSQGIPLILGFIFFFILYLCRMDVPKDAHHWVDRWVHRRRYWEPCGRGECPDAE